VVNARFWGFPRRFLKNQGRNWGLVIFSAHGFRARKLIPFAPKAAALDSCGAPLNTSAFQVISKSVKPVATTVACSSASSKAPAIQPVHRSRSALTESGTSLETRMSPICSRPPGFRIRCISVRAALGKIRFPDKSPARPSHTRSDWARTAKPPH